MILLGFCILHAICLSLCLDKASARGEFFHAGDDSEVLAIDANSEEIAVATYQNIYIYSQLVSRSLPQGSLLGKISLPIAVNKHPGFLELKLLGRKQVLYCDAFNCRFCTATSSNSSCSLLDLSLGPEHPSFGKNLLHASATRSNDPIEKIYLRVVSSDNSNTTAILSYDLQDVEKVSNDQLATDVNYIRFQNVVSSFSRGNYVYFVGSAVLDNEPLLNANIEFDGRPLNVVKITRVCTKDITKRMESRIDIHLTCGLRAFGARAAAAHYDSSTAQLYVAFESAKQNHTICSYDISNLDREMDNVWNTCQAIGPTGEVECEQRADPSELKSHCFIFTRMSSSYRTCARFGLKGDTYNNCELNRYESTANRYGWLESFAESEAQTGQPISHVPSEFTILALLYDRKSHAVFVSVKENDQASLLRIPAGNSSTIVWKTPITSESRKVLGFSKDGEAVLIVNASNIVKTRISCPDLYRSCDALDQGGWYDPLGCVFCVDDNNRQVFADRDRFACPAGRKISHVCPPTAERAIREENRTEWVIYGSHWDRLQNSEVHVCNRPCIINPKYSGHYKLHCYLADGSVQDDNCEIRIVGKLGGVYNFSVRIPPDRVTKNASAGDDYNPPTSNASSSKSKAWKAVLAVVVVVLILGALALIVWFARKRMARPPKNQDSPDMRSGSILPRANTYVDTNGMRMEQLYYSPVNYEVIFREIDDRLKVDASLLRFETEIGRGHFGVVNKATMVLPDGGTKKVACKMINEGVAGVREFISEGLVMDRFDHPRVMRLIGISFTDRKCPIIITDFMSNGDLVAYLRNKNNAPTLRNLLTFAIQIAEGMEYLHSQKFIHRDLAARNCMLDDDFNIKIADFGLCRECNNDQMYEPSIKNRELPLRWMAIEAIESETFTLQGDVWAYGVVLWELMTRGVTPYGHTTGLALLSFLKEGQRLDIPPYCPQALYDEIMYPCWNVEPGLRPTFSELVDRVNDLVRSMESSQNTQLHSEYEKVSSINSKGYENNRVST